MFRKLSLIVALFTVLAFGGTFNQAAEASTTQHAKQDQYKVFYSINGNTGSFDKEDINQLLRQAMERLQGKWQTKHTEKAVEVPVESVEQSKQAESKKESQPVPVEKQEEVPNEKPVESNEQPKEEVATPKPQEEDVQENESQKAEEQVTSLTSFEVEVVELTNKERAQQGLQPFQIDEELSRVAREKSRDMAANHYFDHNSPVYGSPFDMMKSYGINYRTAGENIAKGQRTPAEVVNAWMNSPGHRANILNGNFTHIGVGHLEQGNHWTQMFIGK